MNQELGILVQTNKKGFGIAVWESRLTRLKTFETLSVWARSQLKDSNEMSVGATSVEESAQARIYSFQPEQGNLNLRIALGSVQTAEGLSQAVQFLQLNFDSLTSIVFAAGPGSFTGLRLGCSFCAGLSFGLHEKDALELYQVNCEVLETIRYSQLFVEDLDVFVSLKNLSMLEAASETQSAIIQRVTNFQPVYGSLPGPVKLLNLGETFK
jgi:hypothetical protein